jgi:hypothetical protein
MGEFLLFQEGEPQREKFLDQSVARLTHVVGVPPAGGGLAEFAFDPLSDLGGLAGVGEDDEGGGGTGGGGKGEGKSLRDSLTCKRAAMYRGLVCERH